MASDTVPLSQTDGRKAGQTHFQRSKTSDNKTISVYCPTQLKAMCRASDGEKERDRQTDRQTIRLAWVVTVSCRPCQSWEYDRRISKHSHAYKTGSRTCDRRVGACDRCSTTERKVFTKSIKQTNQRKRDAQTVLIFCRLTLRIF